MWNYDTTKSKRLQPQPSLFGQKIRVTGILSAIKWIQSWICFISAISVRSSFLFWQQGNKNPNTRKSTLRRFALTSTPQSNQYIDTLYNKPQETGLDFFVIIFLINKLPSYSQSLLSNRVHELGQK